jgi:hypothetical protein
MRYCLKTIFDNNTCLGIPKLLFNSRINPVFYVKSDPLK